MSLDRLLLRVRRAKALRNVWAELRLLEFYLRSMPSWARRQHRRRQQKGAAVARRPVYTLSAPLHIVFVTHYARAREFKLAYAARLCGHRVTLVATHVQSSGMVAQHFDAHYEADDPWQILALLDELRPDVAHLFVNYNNARMLPVVLYAPSPVVYDPYDCLRGMFEPEYQVNWLELEAERICFACADHICARSLEPLCLRRHFGYRMPATTYFPEYCWRPPRQREPRQVRNEELHLVYCGGVWPEDRYPAGEYCYAQYIEIGRALARQRIHLHIYPAPLAGMVDFDCFFSLYLQEDGSNPYFHFHRSLPYPELVREMVQYDAAMHVMGAAINSDMGRVTYLKLDYSTSNKLFDYIESGLPVIIHKGKHQRSIVRHYGQTIEINNISVARQALTQVIGRKKCPSRKAHIAYHAKRLGDMYVEVVKSCAS